MKGRPGCDFSFSGLKTAVRQIVVGRWPSRSARSKADLAASVEVAICDALVDRTANAIAWFRAPISRTAKTLVVGWRRRGQQAIAAPPDELAEDAGLRFVAPPTALCTDNGAMIAWAGIERLRLGLVDGLDAPLRPRWPLDTSAPPRPGAGIKA